MAHRRDRFSVHEGLGRVGGTSFRRHVLALVAAGSVAAVGGCQEEAKPVGQLVLAVSTDMKIDQDLNSVDVLVERENGESYSHPVNLYPAAGGLFMPGTYVIAAGKKEGEGVRVSLAARKGGRMRVVRELVTTLPKRRTAVVPMPLQWLCEGEVDEGDKVHPKSQCRADAENDDATCGLGRCVAAGVDSSTLAEFDRERFFNLDFARSRHMDAESCRILGHASRSEAGLASSIG